MTKRKQCDKCPWKVSTDPFHIPDGYDLSKHVALESTIAKPMDVARLGRPLRIMVCHDTQELPCVGWLVNQVGPGNNLALRIACIVRQVDADVETVGQQHECFKETLPCLD